MSFAPLPLLPAHLTRQNSRTLTTAGGQRRGPRSAASANNKVWRVVTTEGGEEPEQEEDGPSTAIQRGNGVQIPLEKLLKPPGAPSSKPLSEWKASPPTGLTLEELRRRASGQQDEKDGEEAHTFRQEESSPPQKPARGHVVFAPHVKIASGPPRRQASATTTAAAAAEAAEAETVAHDFMAVTTSTAQSSKQPPHSSKIKPTTCGPTSATGRLRHVASKLRPATAPDAPGQVIASSASLSLSHSQSKEANSRPKTETNSPPQHGNAPPSQSRPPIRYCPASGKEPGFPDGYILGRLHPDGPFSSSNRAPPTPSPASIPQALATGDSTFRPARPQELPRVQGRFYEGTLILVREPESQSAEGEGEGQAPAQKQEGEDVGTAPSKRGLASKVKHKVGKLMADAADVVVETQWPPPQRRVVVASAAAAAAAARGRASTSVTLPAAKPRGVQTGKKKRHEGSKQPGSASKPRRKAPPPPPSTPSIPARSSSAEIARPIAEDPPHLTSGSLKSSSSQSDGIVRHASGDLRTCYEQDEATPDNELDTLPIILWSGWASCSSSASSGCSTPSSSSCSSTSHVAPQAPPSPSRRSAFDQSRGHQQGATGRGNVSRNEGKGANREEAAVVLPASSNLLPGLGGAVRLAVKKVANARRPVTPAPAAVVPPPPPLQHVAEKRSGEETQLEDSSGRAALDLPARDSISAAVEPSPAQKLVTPKGSLARASREPARRHAQHRREVRIVVWPRSTPQAGSRSKSRASRGAAAAQHGQEYETEERGEGEGYDSRLAGEEGVAAKSNGAVVFGSELRSILL